MKKLTKIGLIIFSIGLVLSIIFSLVFSINANNLMKISNSSPLINFGNSKNDKTIFKEYENIESIDIDVDFGEVLIEEGDKYTLDINYCSKCKMSFSENIENNVLKVKSQGPRGFWNLNPGQPTIKVTIPKNKKIDSLKIDSNLGVVKVLNQNVNLLEISADAGDVVVDYNEVKSAVIDADMGSVKIRSNIVSLDLKISMGEAVFKGNADNITIKNSMGATSIEILNGYLEEFKVDVDSNMGSISVNDNTQSGMDNSIHLNGDKNLKRFISVNNDMGDVKISFVK